MSDKFEGIPSDDDTMVLVKIPMQFDGLEKLQGRGEALEAQEKK